MLKCFIFAGICFAGNVSIVYASEAQTSTDAFVTDQLRCSNINNLAVRKKSNVTFHGYGQQRKKAAANAAAQAINSAAYNVSIALIAALQAAENNTVQNITLGCFQLNPNSSYSQVTISGPIQDIATRDCQCADCVAYRLIHNPFIGRCNLYDETHDAGPASPVRSKFGKK